LEQRLNCYPKFFPKVKDYKHEFFHGHDEFEEKRFEAIPMFKVLDDDASSLNDFVFPSNQLLIPEIVFSFLKI
jgi:hypothetical protein